MLRATQMQENDLEVLSLESPTGLRVQVLNLGATLMTLEVPTATGRINVVLSYPKLPDYLDDRFFTGCTVGPFANRIRNAQFSLDGEEYQLEANEQPAGHCLHGGSTGLHRQLFDLQRSADGTRIRCRCKLPDGHGGFPGNRTITVIYELLDDLSLAIDMIATSDRNTVISLANHAYFNLGGSIDEHHLRLRADAYTPKLPCNIPSGEIRSVRDTRYDLRRLQRLGRRSFDHNFVLGETNGPPRRAAELVGAESDLRMTVYTTQPGVQLYTADALAEPFAPRRGLCLETQSFPDAPNQEGFPSARLAAASASRHRTILQFSHSSA